MIIQAYLSPEARLREDRVFEFIELPGVQDALAAAVATLDAGRMLVCDVLDTQTTEARRTRLVHRRHPSAFHPDAVMRMQVTDWTFVERDA
jgi:hypothetical protein